MKKSGILFILICFVLASTSYADDYQAINLNMDAGTRVLANSINNICQNGTEHLSSKGAPLACAIGSEAKPLLKEKIYGVELNILGNLGNFLKGVSSHFPDNRIPDNMMKSIQECRKKHQKEDAAAISCLYPLVAEIKDLDEAGKKEILKPLGKARNYIIARSVYVSACLMASENQKSPISNLSEFFDKSTAKKSNDDCYPPLDKVFGLALDGTSTVSKAATNSDTEVEKECHADDLEGLSCEDGLYSENLKEKKFQKKIQGAGGWINLADSEAKQFTGQNKKLLSKLLQAQLSDFALRMHVQNYLEKAQLSAGSDEDSIFMNHAKKSLAKLFSSPACIESLGEKGAKQVLQSSLKEFDKAVEAVLPWEKKAGLAGKQKLTLATKSRKNHLALAGACMSTLKKRYEDLKYQLGIDVVKATNLLSAEEISKLPLSEQIIFGVAEGIPGIGMGMVIMRNTPHISGLSEAATRKCSNYYLMFAQVASGTQEYQQCLVIRKHYMLLKSQFDIISREFPELMEDVNGKPAYDYIAGKSKDSQGQQDGSYRKANQFSDEVLSQGSCMGNFQSEPEAPTPASLDRADPEALRAAEFVLNKNRHQILGTLTPEFEKDSLLGQIEALCKNSEDFGEAVLTNKYLREQFYSCERRPYTTLTSYLANDFETLPAVTEDECKDKLSSRYLAGEMLCKIQADKKRNGYLKELGMKGLVGSLDIFGAMAPIGILGRGVRYGALGAARAVGKEMLLGGAIGGAIGYGFHKLISPEESLKKAIAEGRTGFSNAESFELALNEIKQLREGMHPAVLSAAIGMVDGGFSVAFFTGELAAKRALASLPNGERDLPEILRKSQLAFKKVAEADPDPSIRVAAQKAVDAIEETLGHKEQVGVMEFLGMAGKNFSNPHLVLTSIHDKHGPAAYLKVPGIKRKIYFLAEPEAIDGVLKDTNNGKNGNWEKSPLTGKAFAPLVGENNVFTAPAQIWKRQRKDVASMFNPKMFQTKEFSEKMQQVIERSFDKWGKKIKESGGEISVNVSSEMTDITLGALLDIFFGVKPSFGELQDLRESFAVLLKSFSYEAANPGSTALHKLPNILPAQGKLKEAHAMVDKYTQSLITARRKNPKKPGEERDLLDRILEAKDGDGKPVSDNEIANQIKTYLLSGHETTSTALTWAFQSILSKPEIKNKLIAEVNQHYPTGTKPTTTSMDSLNYLDQVWEENLRLNSPVALITRRAEKPTTVTVAGKKVAVKEGDDVVLSTFYAHRNEAQWGEGKTGFPAKGYHPERYSKEMMKAHGLKAGDMKSYPFGAGNRVCIGQFFANAEAKMVLANMFQKYDIELANPATVVKTTSDSSYRIDGPVMIKLRERK